MDKVVDIKDRMAREDEENLVDDYVRTSEIVQKTFSPIDDQSDMSGYGVWNEEVKAWLDLNTLKGLFFNDDWVYILVDLIASKIASQEMRVMKQSYRNGVAIYEPEESNPIQQLIYEPNENQTYYQWIYSIVVDLILTGNAIIYKPTSVNSMIHVPVEMIQLDFDTDGRLNFYRVIQYNTNYEMPLPRLIMKLDPKQVGHVRRPNPSSALWGLSPFIPGRKSILFSRYSIEYLNNFYLKGAQPGLVLSFDDTANEKAALRLLRSMEMAHTGRKNQRRNMILPKGVKAAEVHQTLADQQLKDYVELNRETIINILKVPKHELSLQTKGSLGSEEYNTALRNFWSGPLKSTMKSIEASLTKLLKDMLGEGRHLEFDLTDVQFLQDDMNQKADLSIKLLQTHTLNEVRAKVFDEDPLEGGDVVPSPKPIQSLNPTVTEPKKEMEAAPAPEPQVQTPEVSEHEKILTKNKLAFETLRTTKGDWWAKRDQMLQRNEVQRFAKVHAISLMLFANQIAQVVKIVKKDLASQGFKSKTGSSRDLVYIRKEDFKKTELQRKIRDALASLEQTWLDSASPTLEESVDLGYNAQLILPFNLPNKSELEALRIARTQNRLDAVQGRLTKTFANLNATTTDKVMRIIEEGVTNSRTIQDIANNIVQEVGSPEVNDARAQTIARTEVLTASSLGQAAAMKDAAEVIPDLKKMWVNAGDDRVRGNPGGRYKDSEADHWTLGGELRDNDEDFSNGLSYPRDPKGDAAEVINCRCTFIMVPGQDADALGIKPLQESYDDLQGTDNANGE
jgi:HK97 family phage portal protein